MSTIFFISYISSLKMPKFETTLPLCNLMRIFRRVSLTCADLFLIVKNIRCTTQRWAPIILYQEYTVPERGSFMCSEIRDTGPKGRIYRALSSKLLCTDANVKEQMMRLYIFCLTSNLSCNLSAISISYSFLSNLV